MHAREEELKMLGCELENRYVVELDEVALRAHGSKLLSS